MENLRESAYDSSIHPPQLSDISTDDITRTGEEGISERLGEMRVRALHDTANELDHTVGDTAEGPDCEDLQRFVNSGDTDQGAARHRTALGFQSPYWTVSSGVLNLILPPAVQVSFMYLR